jgi:hypothetical protein
MAGRSLLIDLFADAVGFADRQPALRRKDGNALALAYVNFKTHAAGASLLLIS